MKQDLIKKQVNHHDANDRVLFGFWVYLMTDLLMFSILFAVYAVLHANTAGGETGRELFGLPLALTEMPEKFGKTSATPPVVITPPTQTPPPSTTA